jgi:hypothetical protein
VAAGLCASTKKNDNEFCSFLAPALLPRQVEGPY